MRNKNTSVVPYLLSLIPIIFWTIIFQCILAKHISGSAQNLIYYISVFPLFIASYMICPKILPNISESRETKKPYLWIILTSLIVTTIFVLFFFFETRMFDNGSFYQPWHNNHTQEIIVCFIIVIIGFFTYIHRNLFSSVSSSKGIFFVYTMLATLCAYAIYQLNMFTSDYNMHHVHAYFNSVYRVIHGGGYSETDTGIYGFYAILIGPLVRLLGGTFKAFIILMCILTFLSAMSFFYAVHNIVHNILLKLLCCFGISYGFVAVSGNMYLQNYPHRHIFVGFLLAYMVIAQRKCIYRKYGWILCILSIVWNFETGIGCTLGYIGFEVISDFESNKTSLFKTTIKKSLMLPLCVFGAFAMVNIYNLVVGSSFLHFKTFLFPFIGSASYMDNINTSLEMFPSLWMPICAFFMCTIAIILNQVFARRKNKCKHISIVAGSVIIVAIQMTYYINRTAYGNLSITIPVLSILIAFVTELFLQEEIENPHLKASCIKGVLAAAMITLLITISFRGICKYYITENQREQNRDTTSVNEFMSAIDQWVPDGTPAFGIGIPEIYSYLHRDTTIYCIDFSDFAALTPEKQQIISQKISRYNSLFVEQSGLDFLTAADPSVWNDFYDTHTGTLIYEANGFSYYYYTEN